MLKPIGWLLIGAAAFLNYRGIAERRAPNGTPTRGWDEAAKEHFTGPLANRWWIYTAPLVALALVFGRK